MIDPCVSFSWIRGRRRTAVEREIATFHREKEVQSSVQELRDRGRPSKGVFINRINWEVPTIKRIPAN